MYRNVVIVGLVGGVVGAGAATLATGGGGVTSATGAVQRAGNRLVDEQGRAAGRCVTAAGDARCQLSYPLDGGQVRATGVIRSGRRSVLTVTGGTGAYAGAYGRVVVEAGTPLRIALAFDLVTGAGA